MECVVQPASRSVEGKALPATAQFPFGGMTVPIRAGAMAGQVVYRCPTTLTLTEHGARLGQVFAILAGEGNDGFTGARLNFRDIISLAKNERTLIYVVPSNQVVDGGIWRGYVRLGHNHWVSIPCPRPQAIYNRIPNRALERKKSAVRAREILSKLRIPVFNPEYFSKWRIYEIIERRGLTNYMPDTELQLTESALLRMLQKHPAVYLKPSGGSVGHGMIRIETGKGGWNVYVLKNGRTSKHLCTNYQDVWQTVKHERVLGRYVIQQAIALLEYRGHPCDFRVLLQKQSNTWRMVGRGVRVSGTGRITTHVPNGGSIASADAVLAEAYADGADKVEAELETFVTRAAEVIDEAYRGELGEMSMDIGIDAGGHPWFFEANAKPMKFDEPDIRQKSLKGVLTHLRERAGLA